MAQTQASERSGIPSLTVINGQLPVLNNGHLPDHAPRPVFGSPEVAKYGAVGLNIRLPDWPGHSGSNDVIPASKSEDGQRDVFQVSSVEPLPLVDHLAHHEVDDHHLWIAVEDGKVIVADDADHEIMKAYVEGCSPVGRLGAPRAGSGPRWRRGVAGDIGLLGPARGGRLREGHPGLLRG